MYVSSVMTGFSFTNTPYHVITFCCAKIGTVRILHFNPWIKIFNSRGFLQPSTFILRYLLETADINQTFKINFINSFQMEGLSPSCTALSFNGFVPFHVLVFRLFIVLPLFRNSMFFGLKITKRDIDC
jgi:hypothetical protein